MAKKSSKNQPKGPSTADFNNPAPPISITTSQLTFSNFLTIATTENIKEFLKFTATTPEGKNLEYLWGRTYKEGYESGQKTVLQNIGRKLEEKIDEGVKRGMDLGCEEGYMVTKEAFDSMIMKIKARNTPKVDTSDADTQTDPTPSTDVVSTHMDILIAPPPSFTSISTQTDYPTHLNVENASPVSMDMSQSSTMADFTQKHLDTPFSATITPNSLYQAILTGLMMSEHFPFYPHSLSI